MRISFAVIPGANQPREIKWTHAFHIVAILKPLPKHVLQFVYLLIPLSLLFSMQVLEYILLGAIYLQEIYKGVLPWVPAEVNVSPLFFSIHPLCFT